MPPKHRLIPTNTPKRVAVFGGGIAGLTVAHELIRRGHAVDVYEAEPNPGGFFRSARLKRDGNMPSEYSWHGMGPWYVNVFDLMKETPFDGTGSVYDKALSRPIDFGIFPDHGAAAFFDKGVRSIPEMFGLSRWEFVKAAWLMLHTWASRARTQELYAATNAAEAWKPLMSEAGYLRWRSCFGPWIGSDYTKCSLHTAGEFFRKQLTSQPTHEHPADEAGPAWTQGTRDGWLLLRGPSSEYWFDRWVRYLESLGTIFHWNAALERLHFDGRQISGAEVKGETVVHDIYVLATTPFAAAAILAQTPELEKQDELALFAPLIHDGPHTQVSFRIAFAERIAFPRARTAVVVANSEWNLTLFAEEQVWRPEVSLGRGVESLWTGTSCTGNVPGHLFNLPVARCTADQFEHEVKAQLLKCESLDAMIREANGGRGLANFEIIRFEVWNEWTFSPDGIRPHQPKWVTTTNTQPFQPKQRTPVPNLVLAGAHTRTAADVWSIEGAVESGRHAARLIDPNVHVLDQRRAAWLRALAAMDDVCYRFGWIHILDLLLGLFLIITGAAIVVGGYWWLFVR